MYEKCKSEYLLMFTASENEDIDTELFETSHLAGMQITTVNIFIIYNINVAKSDVLMKKSVDLFINHKFTF